MTHDEYRAKYNTKMTYPSKKDYTMYYVYKSGKMIFSGNVDEFNAARHQFGANPTVEQVLDDEAYNSHRDEYSADVNRLGREFKMDLFEEHCVLGHPKAEKCFAIAWDMGHSAGYGEVASYFDTLVELIKD